MKKILLNLEENSLIALSLLMIWGTAVYYIYQLSWLGVLISLFLSILSFYFLRKKTIDKNKENRPLEKSWLFVWWPIIIYLFLNISLFWILIKNSSSEALISPWTSVPKIFFLILLASNFWLFYVLGKNIKKSFKLNLLRLHYFLTFSIAVIVYKIGYGFDPFIHQATIELIDQKGAVLPKPFYYLGQYSLITIVHKLSGISIYILNKFLVPALASIFLPGALYRFLNEHGSSKRSFLSILSLLALPSSLFILSTPQNLSYLWLLLLVIYSFTNASLALKTSLALATACIHPVSGLPALFFLVWLQLLKHKDRLKSLLKKAINPLMWLLSALSLPIAFAFISGQSIKQISFSFGHLENIFNLANIPQNKDNLILNFLYLLADNWPIIFISLSIFGISVWLREKKEEAVLLVKMASALLTAFILTSFLSFNFLINYERGDYSERLPILMALFMLPAIIIAVNNLVDKTWRNNRNQIISSWILASVLITSSLYLSYPRIDAYNNSKGFSVSRQDIEAVRSISSQTKNKYVVLANQQTSVAALKELGFDNYFNNGDEQIFFYPIPTGGKLYQYYLKMVDEKPRQETMHEAMDLAGVKESYFVINKYWTFSNRIIAEAKLQSDKFWNIEGGSIYIFKYER